MKVVEMNKDVRNYKDKLLGPFSGREVLCLICGFVTSYIVKSLFFPEMSPLDERMAYLVILCMLPFGFIGWWKIYGMYIGQYLKSTFITSLAPRLRVYDNGNGIKKMRKKVKTKPSKSRNLKRYQ